MDPAPPADPNIFGGENVPYVMTVTVTLAKAHRLSLSWQKS